MISHHITSHHITSHQAFALLGKRLKPLESAANRDELKDLTFLLTCKTVQVCAVQTYRKWAALLERESPLMSITLIIAGGAAVPALGGHRGTQEGSRIIVYGFMPHLCRLRTSLRPCWRCPLPHRAVGGVHAVTVHTNAMNASVVWNQWVRATDLITSEPRARAARSTAAAAATGVIN